MKKLSIVSIIVILLSACMPQNTANTANTTYRMGDTITIDDIEITIDDIEISDKITLDHGSFSPSGDGNVFLIVHMALKNSGKTAQTIFKLVTLNTDIRAVIVYDGEYEYISSNLLGYDDDLSNTNLNPLTSKTGVKVFEVANEVADSNKSLALKIYQDKTEFIFNLR